MWDHFPHLWVHVCAGMYTCILRTGYFFCGANVHKTRTQSCILGRAWVSKLESEIHSSSLIKAGGRWTEGSTGVQSKRVGLADWWSPAHMHGSVSRPGASPHVTFRTVSLPAACNGLWTVVVLQERPKGTPCEQLLPLIVRWEEEAALMLWQELPHLVPGAHMKALGAERWHQRIRRSHGANVFWVFCPVTWRCTF